VVAWDNRSVIFKIATKAGSVIDFKNLETIWCRPGVHKIIKGETTMIEKQSY